MNQPKAVWMESYGGLYIRAELVDELLGYVGNSNDPFTETVKALLEDESYRPDHRPVPADVAALANE